MPEQPGGSSDLSRNQSTGKPRQQRDTNMVLKFHKIMHVPYNLMSITENDAKAHIQAPC